MSGYEYKTQPFKHQREMFEKTRDWPIAALFLEMGLGKSKIITDTAAWLYEQGEIDAFVVVAPNGVHTNWTIHEVPKHLPDRVPYKMLAWKSGKMSSRDGKFTLEELLKFNGLAIFAVNAEAIVRAQNCRKFVEKFLTKRKVLLVIDESIIIKSPGAALSKAMVALGRRAEYKRICSGVPITQGPLDLFSQFQFLREGCLGTRSFYVFKHQFADWEEKLNHNTNIKFEQLLGYKNQDRLVELCAHYTLRATKEECLDLPPKIYERRLFTLSDEQRKLYDTLRDQYIAELTAMEHIPVSHALTRILRLQQVCSGFWPETREGQLCQQCQGEGCDRCGDLGYVIETTPLRSLGKNARLIALQDALSEINADRQIIIWTRFRRDVDEITNVLGADNVSRYYGDIKGDARAESLAQFQAGKTRYFVGTARAGGRGLTLTGASVVVFFSHDYSFETRAQAEDRAHRIGQTRSVTYLDLIAEDTVDERLMEVVAQKRDLAALFDKPENWI